MLINYVDDNGNVDNSYHTVWQRELTKMGYPEGDNGYKMRVVSISNGQTPVIDCRNLIYMSMAGLRPKSFRIS